MTKTGNSTGKGGGMWGSRVIKKIVHFIIRFFPKQVIFNYSKLQPLTVSHWALFKKKQNLMTSVFHGMNKPTS